MYKISKSFLQQLGLDVNTIDPRKIKIYGNGGNGTFNTCVQVISTTGLNYCTASNTDCGFEYITFVGLTTLGNTSDCGDPYDDFTNQIAYLRTGQTYTGHIKKSDILHSIVFF